MQCSYGGMEIVSVITRNLPLDARRSVNSLFHYMFIKCFGIILNYDQWRTYRMGEAGHEPWAPFKGEHKISKFLNLKIKINRQYNSYSNNNTEIRASFRIRAFQFRLCLQSQYPLQGASETKTNTDI